VEEKPKFRWYWLVEPDVLFAYLVTVLYTSAVFVDDRQFRARIVGWFIALWAVLSGGVAVFVVIKMKLRSRLTFSYGRFRFVCILYTIIGLLLFAFLTLRQIVRD